MSFLVPLIPKTLIVLMALYAGETLKEEDTENLSVFENDCLRTLVGISCMNHIKIDNRSDLEIKKSLTFSKRKDCISHDRITLKIMPTMLTIYTRMAFYWQKILRATIKVMEWSNKTRYKTSSVNSGKTGKRQDKNRGLVLTIMCEEPLQIYVNDNMTS